MSKKGRGKTTKGKAADAPAPPVGPPPDRATLEKAKRFSKDVERLLAKHRAKLEPKDAEKLEAAIQGVRDAIDGTADGKRLSTALKELDARADQILGFAKKSTSREYVESIAVAVLIAFLLRAFVVEAFKIPTGSMIPTLAVGDHIFVNKFIYGLRVPLTNSWFVEWGSPERGDVIVFRYPRDLSKDYIKRVVAVAGDRVRVEGQDVFVNGKKLEREAGAEYAYLDEGEPEGFFSTGPSVIRKALAYGEHSLETDVQYTVLYEPERFGRRPFPSFEEPPGMRCGVFEAGASPECEIQPGFVFVMGDNRDNSSDSRVWGGVPIPYVKGKAMFVWMSFGREAEDGSESNGLLDIRWGRIGHSVH